MQEVYEKPLTESEAMSLAVRDIMSYPVVTAKEKTSIRDIAKLMKKHDVDAVVILDKAGSPAGIITEGDIVRRLVSAKRNLWFIKADHVMSKPLLTIGRDSTLEGAAKYMAEKKVKKLCVVDDGNRLAGMITTEDITKNAGYLINVLEEVIHTGYYMSVL
ncbi:MAG: CBS domain-containing protein [Candidatus Micrarchaeota archaeon]|nr:CBS domain-containing protein [Candidatus Micrarchaeota archaeon]